LLLACQIEIRLAACEDPCTETELEGLIALHERGRRLGCHDEVMFALYMALKKRDREGEGIEVLREYLGHHRRDGFPVDFRLLRLMSQAPSLLEEFQP